LFKWREGSVENQNVLPWYYHHGQGWQHDNWFIL
jgi:glycogen debranching enzyme